MATGGPWDADPFWYAKNGYEWSDANGWVRVRDVPPSPLYPDPRDVTISRLTSALATAAEALKPFAKGAAAMELECPGEPDGAVYEIIGPEVRRYGEWEKTADCVDILHGDLRRARSTYAAIKAAMEEKI